VKDVSGDTNVRVIQLNWAKNCNCRPFLIGWDWVFYSKAGQKDRGNL